MELYTPVLALAALAAVFAIGSVVMSMAVGPRRYNRAKLDSYECGIEPTPQPAGGGRFPVKYYITAMLFIVFDIEIIFLYHGPCSSTPWGSSGWSRWSCSSAPCSSRTPTCGAAAASTGIESCDALHLPAFSSVDDRSASLCTKVAFPRRPWHAQRLATLNLCSLGKDHRWELRRSSRAASC